MHGPAHMSASGPRGRDVAAGAGSGRGDGRSTRRRCTFPRRKRLRGRTMFRAVFENGEKQRDGTLLLFVLANGLTYSRLGIVVSKRSHGKRAVDRNRVKRLVREAYRLTQRDTAVGVDIICIPMAARRRPHRLEAFMRSFTRLLRPEKCSCSTKTSSP